MVSLIPLVLGNGTSLGWPETAKDNSPTNFAFDTASCDDLSYPTRIRKPERYRCSLRLGKILKVNNDRETRELNIVLTTCETLQIRKFPSGFRFALPNHFIAAITRNVLDGSTPSHINFFSSYLSANRQVCLSGLLSFFSKTLSQVILKTYF